ncbi:conserved hypothetical protein [Bacillus cereus AH1134]|nr:conserved hypothetical protein [Bacillus cereus AH1134]
MSHMKNIQSVVFELKTKVTYAVKTKMNLQKHNENKLNS